MQMSYANHGTSNQLTQLYRKSCATVTFPSLLALARQIAIDKINVRYFQFINVATPKLPFTLHFLRITSVWIIMTAQSSGSLRRSSRWSKNSPLHYHPAINPLSNR